jgi:hypothetical protein
MSPNNLFAALLAAQRATPARIAPDGRGPYGPAVTVDHWVEAARLALHGAGLILVERSCLLVSRLEEEADRQTGELRPRAQLVLDRTWDLVHPASGERETLRQAWPVLAARGRGIDHATAAASSFGLAYLLRGLLFVARGDAEVPGAESAPEAAPRSQSAPAAARDRDIHDLPPSQRLGGVYPRPAAADPVPEAAPDAERLRALGWVGPPSAEDLEALGDAAAPLPLIHDLDAAARELLGSREAATAAWQACGVPTLRRAVVAGSVCRRVAAYLVTAAEEIRSPAAKES